MAVVKWALILGLILSATLLGGCTNAHDPEADALLEQALRSLEARDWAAFTALFDDEVQKKMADVDFASDLSYYQGTMQSFEQVGWRRNASTQNGERTVLKEDTYRVTTDQANYLVVVSRRGDDTSGTLVGLHLYNYDEYMASQPTGVFGQFDNWITPQWLLLGYTVVHYLFILWTFIHAIGHKMRKKPLFILLIWIQVALGISSLAGTLRLSAKIWLFGISSLLIYPQQGWGLLLCVPLGAILYWVLPKNPPKPKQGDRPEIPDEALTAPEAPMERASESDLPIDT